MTKGEETRLRNLTSKKEALALNFVESKTLKRLQEMKRFEKEVEPVKVAGPEPKPRGRQKSAVNVPYSV